VQSGLAHRGVVPFENSSNGSVVVTLDLFADLQGQHPDILVCGEAYVEVRHCLVGYAAKPSSARLPSSPPRPQNNPPTATTNTISASPAFPAAEKDTLEPGKPLSDLSHIKTLYSHPQAWGQCTSFLATHLKHAEKHDASSTSRAAQIVAQQDDEQGPASSAAALSSSIAAALFGLDILAHTVNDRVGNTTRFLVLQHRNAAAAEEEEEVVAVPSRDDDNDDDHDDTSTPQRFKSLLTFTPDNDAHPGALANCLAAFSAQGINLTSINTRPSGRRNWNYVFFVELEGRLEGGGGGEEEEEEEEEKENGGAVAQALKDLGKVCSGFRWLGSWVDRTPV